MSRSGPAAAAALLLLLVTGCGGRGSDAGSPGGDRSGGLVHVHGLGNNPADGQVYAATHTGIFRLGPSGASRVPGPVQDTMGFTVVGPDTFLGSGHPGPDAPGPADPDSGQRVIATTAEGLLTSTDGGRTFAALPVQPPRPLILIGHAPRIGGGGSTTLAGVDAAGTPWAFSGTTWTGGTSAGGAPQAFAVLGPDRYVVATDRAVRSTEDAGRTWTDIAATG